MPDRMESCDHSTDSTECIVVYHYPDTCPLCKAREQISDLEDEIFGLKEDKETLENDNAKLESDNKELQDRIYGIE
jgi:hypothetical protein